MNIYLTLPYLLCYRGVGPTNANAHGQQQAPVPPPAQLAQQPQAALQVHQPHAAQVIDIYTVYHLKSYDLHIKHSTKL